MWSENQSGRAIVGGNRRVGPVRQRPPAHNPALRIIAAQGDTAHSALCNVVIDLQTAIVEEARQRDPALAAIGDGFGHLGLGRQTARCIV